MPSAPDRSDRPRRSSHRRSSGSADHPRGHLRSVPGAPSSRGESSPHPVPAPGGASGSSATAVQFSESVRKVVAVARRHGLRPPVFRSPPRLAGVDRTIRRRASGQVVVAVRRAGRPLAAVRADIIDGVAAANGLAGAEADRFRHAAWAGLEPVERAATGGAGVANAGRRPPRGGAPDRGERAAQVA